MSMTATFPPPAPPVRPRRRRWPLVVMVVAAVLVLAGVIASRIQLNYYVLTPGDAQNIGPLIKVPAGQSHRIRGEILLTDVFVSQVSLLDYLPDVWNSNAEVVPSVELLGPNIPADQLAAQGFLEMAQSQSAAKASALESLGYKVTEHDAGAIIFAVGTKTPAASVLKVAQIVTAVDGIPTPNACAFVATLHALAPGDVARLSVEQSTVTTSGVIDPGKVVVEAITLSKAPAGEPSSGCPGVVGPSKTFLGVQIETQQDFDYPIAISVNTTNIGGPSAGLSMTLGIIDALTDGELTDGKKIAATGTIDPQGDIGDVGGVAEKTIAVEQAGAVAFLVPPEEYKVALSKATPSLHIYAVSTLAQALKVLAKLGGHIPTHA
jgi:PDZ domain-containing protein